MAEPQSTWADAATIRPVDTSDVVVVGAGPTGLMMAAELALGGAKVQLLEERIDMPNITRAFAVHARTLELLDARGMADELLTRGAAGLRDRAAGWRDDGPAGAAGQIRRCC